ncbi:MAG: acyl carrier protein [Verrucomicrobiae bacterium]|nr:acyl carrier protein [Verrucomicrobiae bacterium]
MSQANDPKLINCFQSVFPELVEDEIAKASMASLPSWDSLATVNLISVIEESYQTQISDDELDSFTSFELIADMMSSRIDD